MPDREGLHNLEDVLERLQSLGHGSGEVSVGDVQHEIGQRSFGPLMVVLGLIVLSPVGSIPGVPTIFGIIVLLTAGQLLIGGRHFWLPGFISRRSVKASRLGAVATRLRPAAQWVDRLLRPRLVLLTGGPAAYVIAGCCIALAVLMPILELVPYLSAGPAFAITAFGLALLANDGVVAAIGFAATALSLYLVLDLVPTILSLLG